MNSVSDFTTLGRIWNCRPSNPLYP